MNIGKKIKEARLSKGYTQEELGNMLGVQKAAVGKWENGRVVNIKRSMLKKLADVLDMNPSELIFEDSPEDTAELHARILMDHEVMDMIEEYYKLGKKDQEVIKKMIHTLAAAN